MSKLPEIADRCTTRASLEQYLNEIASDAAAGDIGARETARLHREAIKAHFAYIDRMAAVRDAQVTESKEGKVSRNPSATSAKAARKVALKSGTQRAEVLAYLVAHAGATDSEIARDLHMGLNSVRPRRGELVESGHASDSGRTRDDHTVWEATAEGRAWALRHTAA